MRTRWAALALAVFFLDVTTAAAQLSPQMTAGIDGARTVAPWPPSRRALAVRALLHLAHLPSLGAATSLTPNAPLAADGTHLSFWKPSFVLGTQAGGEAGFNFWGIYVEGHVNVGLVTKSAQRVVLDCRLLSSATVSYKLFVGNSANPRGRATRKLDGGHLLLALPSMRPGTAVSVELWPAPAHAALGFLGCDLSTLESHT